MKNFLIAFGFALGICMNQVQAHDIPPEILQFLSENPDATEAEFASFAQSLEGEESELWSESEEVESSFNLPPELVSYLIENPDAQTPEIVDFINQNDSLKNTNWAEDIKLLVDGSGFDEESPFALNDLVLLNQVQETFDEVYEPKTEVNWLQFAKNYIVLGIQHILGGLDHILFVISLVLLLPSPRRILLMVTTFTLAHSLTLILGGTEILTLSSKIVEPIIAASIAYVALTSVFLGKKNPWFADQHNALMMVFIFGLFHGLGFAGVFAEFAPDSENLLPSLLFFNIGVEIGQLLILCLVLPFFWLVYKLKIDKYVIPALAILMSAMALWWMFVRIFA